MDHKDVSVSQLDKAAKDARIYTQANITKMLGMEPKTFQTLVSRGVLPDAPTTSGTGDWRRYTLDHAIGFAAFSALVDLGLPPRLVRGLAALIDFTVQRSNDPKWLVIRRNKRPDDGKLLMEDGFNWEGDGAVYDAIGVSDADLARAIKEAGDWAILLPWKDIRNRVLTQAAAFAEEQ